MKLLILAAASLAVVSCASLSLEDLEFQAWKLRFGKVYSSPEEEARRKDIWLSTRRRVLAHNILADQGIKTYHMGMNHLSDMDEHEFMTLYSSLLPEDLNSTAQCAVVSPTPLDGTVLPKSVNWTAKGCVTPVKNQGYECGSCWAFSAVGALESHTCIKHQQKRLTPLSEQQLVDCSGSYNNSGCGGGTASGAFRYCVDNKGIVTEEFYPYVAKVGSVLAPCSGSYNNSGCGGGTASGAFMYCVDNKGIVTEESYPYVAKTSTCCFTNNNPIPSDQIGARCSGCRRLPGDEPSLQRAVAETGPVSITIPVHESFRKYESGVYYEPNCKSPPPNNMYHLMLVVGYGTTTKGEDYWLVKNSHGASWGEAGYIRMARNKNNNCGIATYAFYPVVK